MTEPESVRLSGKKCPLCPPEHPRWIFSSPEIEVLHRIGHLADLIRELQTGQQRILELLATEKPR